MVKGMSMSDDGQTVAVESAHYNSTVIRMVHVIRTLCTSRYGYIWHTTEEHRDSET